MQGRQQLGCCVPHSVIRELPQVSMLSGMQGWSPERSQRFGHAFLNAVLAVVPDLR